MYFHLSVRVLREMYENEVDGIIHHLEKEHKVHFQQTEFNKMPTSLVSLRSTPLNR